MRITDGTRQREVLANLQRSGRALDKAQTQISSGLRVQRASDDPGAALSVLKLGGSLRAVDTHRRNIDAAMSRVSSEETVLDQLGDTLARARELGVSQGSDTASTATRQQTKVEVDKLLEFAVQLGNTRDADGYLFGGYASDQRPFDPADPLASTVSGTDQHMVEIGPGQQVKSSHNGREVFLDTGALKALKDLSTALGADDADGVRTALGSLQGSFDSVQTLLGETGGRYNQLELTRTRLDSLEQSTSAEKASLQEADMEKTMVELVTRQNSLQAAMLSTSRVLGMTLADYLR